MCPAITWRKKSRVLASWPAEKETCPLLTFDLPYVTFFYNQKILLYHGGSETEEAFESTVESLKKSLGEALAVFYPLAGKLARDDEGVLLVDCCNVGVEFVIADGEDVEVAELAAADASPLLQDVVPYTGIQNHEGFDLPLLGVQVTKLKDGIALGCAFNHVILDGHSTWHFMSSWAELARGATTVSLLPFHDRLKARNTRMKLDLPQRTPPAAANGGDAVANGSGGAVDAQQNGESKLPAPPPMREKIFHFSEEAVDKIKAQVNAQLEPDQKPFSTFQALGTHVWRSIIRVRELPPEAYTAFTLFIDCRKRLETPMPDNYFGNVIQGIYTVTACGMLLAQPPEYAAGLLHKLINSHNAAAIDAMSAAWEKSPRLYNYKDAGINCVAVGSSPRFKVYEVDFGWGAPESVRSGSNNKFDGMMYLYAGKEGGRSVDAEITLEAETMKRLDNDEQFLMKSV